MPTADPVCLSQSVEGYLIAARARRLSEETLRSYQRAFSHLSNYVQADPPLASITAHTLRGCLASMTWLSPKSVRIYYTGLDAL